jgi:hypothetical protein
MIIGLISDTHANLARTTAAAAVFRRAGVRAVLHAGDVCSAAVMNELLAIGVPVHAIGGNMDYEQRLPEFMEVALGGKRLAMAHGHDIFRLHKAIHTGGYDYVITGHTHQRRDERIGRTRVINPGAVHRAAPPSVAILDTASDALTFVDLPEDR